MNIWPTSWPVWPEATWPAPEYVSAPKPRLALAAQQISPGAAELTATSFQLVSRKRAVDDAINELACVARGDMACAGVRYSHLPQPRHVSSFLVLDC